VSGRPAIVALPAPRPYGDFGKVADWRINESLPGAVGAFVDWLINESGWTVEEAGQQTAIRPRHIAILFRRFRNFRTYVVKLVEAVEASEKLNVTMLLQAVRAQNQPQRTRNERPRHMPGCRHTSVYAVRFKEHDIWGVTAGILRNLWERIYSERP
jgi:hypothetical protein